MNTQHAPSPAPAASKLGPLLAVTVTLTALTFAAWSWMRPQAMPAAPAPIASVAEAAPAPVAAPAAPRPTLPAELTADPAAERARIESMFATFESRFVEDTLDPEWSRDAEDKLIGAASEPALTRFGVPDEYNASCSGHLCRIQMQFADRNAADDWASFYPVEMGVAVSAVQTQVTYGDDGRAEITMFAARAGSEVLLRPTPEQMRAAAAAGPGPAR